MIRRSRAMLALEELRRAAAAGLGEIKWREVRVVANVGAHVLRDQVVNQRDVVVGNRGVKRRLTQLVVRRKVDPGIDQAGELVEITVLDRAEQRLRRSLRMRAGASEGERGDEGAQSVFHSSSSRVGAGRPETSRTAVLT